jgi:hypothetical protein
LIKATRTEESRIDLVRPVRHIDDEDIFLQIRAVHLRQDLVKDTITSTCGIISTSSTSNSLKNITQGAAAWALLNTSQTLASDSLNHTARSAGPWDGRSMTTLKMQVRQNPHLNADKVRIELICDGLGEQQSHRSQRPMVSIDQVITEWQHTHIPEYQRH